MGVNIRSWGAPVVATAAVLLLAGCSSPAPNAPSSNAPASVTFGSGVSATPGMPGMTAMPPTGSAPAATGSSTTAPAAPVGPNAVNIKDFKFDPATLTVPVGTTVTWTNQDEEPHTVAAKDGSFHSSGLDTHGTYSFTFTTPGTFDYICGIHPFMTGTVVVTK
jgi:amicyanin